MEIKIGIGLDNLIFGMNQDEIKSILGEPDKIKEAETYSAVHYFYNNKLIVVNYDINENLKLYSIEVYNPNVIMFNQKVINKTKDEIITLLEQ